MEKATSFQPTDPQILNNGMKKVEEDFQGGEVEKVTLRRGNNPSLGLSLTKKNGGNVNLNGIFVEAVQEGSIAERWFCRELSVHRHPSLLSLS